MVNVVIDQFATYRHIWIMYNTKSGHRTVRLVASSMSHIKHMRRVINSAFVTKVMPQSDSIVIPMDWDSISGSDPWVLR